MTKYDFLGARGVILRNDTDLENNDQVDFLGARRVILSNIRTKSNWT